MLLSYLTIFITVFPQIGHNYTTAMSSVSSSSVTGTSTSLLLLTTPFVPPRLCRTARDLTTITTTSYMRNGRTVANSMVPYLFSNPANTDYGACLPTPLQQTYAVCPLSWTAYWMSTSLVSSITLSTARCCISWVFLSHSLILANIDYSRGFILDRGRNGTFENDVMCTANYGPESNALHGPTSLLVTMSSGGTPTATNVFSTGLMAHPAWVIAWQKKEQSTISPQPPDLVRI